MKTLRHETLNLEKIVGGGQALGTLDDGRKAFVWGGLPGERVTIRLTKTKAHFVEGIVTDVIEPSPERIVPLDSDSNLSISPWQIMMFDAEQHYKAALVEEAFELHDIVLPEPIEIATDNCTAKYRNKVEFSWYGDTNDEGEQTLDLAFFQRGGKGKVVVDKSSLLPSPMLDLARKIRDFLREKQVGARQIKTLLIRCDQKGNCAWQLYIKEPNCSYINNDEASAFGAQGGEVIYSDPKSPASRITKRLLHVGNPTLTDTILGTEFSYAAESFFQINLPMYEIALEDMKRWVESEGNTLKTIDLYAGVGSIGLTIGGEHCTLIEIDENAVREMRANIKKLDSRATAVLAPSEKALDYITSNATIIIDPPRAGLHKDVIERLLEAAPPRIVYLSCNPVTQARDVALLSKKYGIRAHRGYNFFPRTPHIEHLVVLDRK